MDAVEKFCKEEGVGLKIYFSGLFFSVSVWRDGECWSVGRGATLTDAVADAQKDWKAWGPRQ